MLHSVAGAGPPCFPRLFGASGIPQSPACPFSSVLMSIAPLFSLPAFCRGNFAFPLLLGSTPAAGGGQLQSTGAHVASPKSKYLRDW